MMGLTPRPSPMGRGGCPHPSPLPGVGILSASGFAGCKDGQDGGLHRNGERLGEMNRVPTRNASRCVGE